MNDYKKRKMTLDQSTAKILYFRYKAFLVPILIIFACAFLFISIIIPQIRELFSMKNEEKNVADRISALKQNIKFLSSLDDSSLDSEFQMASSALPSEKDFVGILNAIAIASYNSGAQVDDFSFQVGDLSLKASQGVSRPLINVSVTIKGEVLQTKDFLSELAKAVPISETADVSVNESNSKITVNFLYKPTKSLTFNYTSLITPLSSKEKETLDEISSWSSELPETFFSSPSASPR